MKKKILGLVLVTAMTYNCEGMIVRKVTGGADPEKKRDQTTPIPLNSSVEIVPYYLDKQQSKWMDSAKVNNYTGAAGRALGLPNMNQYATGRLPQHPQVVGYRSDSSETSPLQPCATGFASCSNAPRSSSTQKIDDAMDDELLRRFALRRFAMPLNVRAGRGELEYLSCPEPAGWGTAALTSTTPDRSAEHDRSSPGDPSTPSICTSVAPNTTSLGSSFASRSLDQPANAPALPDPSQFGLPWGAIPGAPIVAHTPVPVASGSGMRGTLAALGASRSLVNNASATPSAAASQGRASLLPDPGDVLTWLWMTRAFVELAEHGTTTFFESMIAPYAEPAQLGHSTTESPTVPLARSAPSINSSVSSPSVDSQLLPNADSVDSNFATSSAGSSILPNANSIDSRFESHSNRSTATEPIPPTSGQAAITIAPPMLLNNNPGTGSLSSTLESNATTSIIASANSTNSSIGEPNPAE